MKSLIWLSFRTMLVAFIALTCVSCSLFPKKELSGTAEERPKVAQGILTSLNSFNASLESTYTSVARGLDETVLGKLDQFIVEGSKKSQEASEQALIIKTGLDILVDLKASRVASNEFEQALESLRTTLVLFNLPTLQYLQTVGRYQLPRASALSMTLSSSENTLASSLATFAAIARRAGIDLENETPFELSDTVKRRVSSLEERVVKFKPETFLYLQPYLAAALQIENTLTESLRVEEQQLFSLSIAENGLLLAGALQTQKDGGQIDTNSLNNTLNEWSVDVQNKSAIAANGGPIPVLAVIPDKAPTLNETTGALPDGNDAWTFVLVEKPTLGSVDLSKNPPEYTPTATSNFSIDRYAFRACLKIIPTFCTSNFSVVVQTPVKPWTISIKTTQGVPAQFRRGDTLVCSAELQSSSQTPVYRWTLVRTEPTFSADITQWEVAPGRLQVTNAITAGGSDLDIREDDKITCEVAARAPNGLQSPFSSPSLATMVAINSPASDIYLAQSGVGFDENIANLAGEPLPVEISELDLTIDDLDINSFPQNLTIEDCDGISLADCPFQVQPPTDTLPNQSGRYSAKIIRSGGLNYEAKPFYNLSLKIVDSAAEELVKIVRVDVFDRNDPVTDILPLQITVAENSTVSEGLSVTDEDCTQTSECQNNGYNYSLSAAPECPACEYFEISGDNNRFLKLKSTHSLNYENLVDIVTVDPNYGSVGDGSVTLNVEVNVTEIINGNSTDHGIFKRVISVVVEDQNESPTNINFARSTPFPLGFERAFYENETNGAELGEFTIDDPDYGENQESVTYTMTLINPEMTGKNILTILGRKILFGPDTNFEDYEEFADNGSVPLTFRVTARDAGGSEYTKDFLFRIYDVNENPTNVYFGGSGDLSSRFIQGSKSDDRTVVSPDATLPLDGSDPDGDTGLTFEIVSVNGSPYVAPTVSHPFVIEGASIKPTRVLDYSVVPDREWAIEVRAQDSGGLYSQPWPLSIKLVEITLTNDDISENTLPQTIGDFCVNDPQNGENCSDWVFSLISAPSINGQQLFNLDGNALKSVTMLNFEEFSSHNIIVRAQSTTTEGLFYERVFTINVTNQNESPASIVFTPSTPAIDPTSTEIYVLAGTAAGTSLGTLYAADEDLAFDVTDPKSELLSWYKSDDPVTSADSEYFEFEYPTENNLKRETIEIKTKMNLPLNKDSFTVTFETRDRAGEDKEIKLVFKVVAYPSLSLESTYGPLDRFSSDLSVAVTDGLNFDLRIDDGTGSASCTKATGDSVGIHVVSLSNPTHAVISESGISISEKESGSGYKICTVNVVPNENAAGDGSVELQVKASTSVGVIASQASLTVPLTFWRQPELRCPERVSLPVGASLSNLQCDVHFIDQSAPADRSSESVTVSGCGLTWGSGTLSGSMSSEQCSATVSVSGVVNKFGVNVSPANKTVQLIPRRFGANGLVRAAARNSTTGDVVLGGDFTAVDPSPAIGATAVNATSGQRASECNFTEGFDGVVRKILYDSSSDSFLIGGDFTHYRGQQARRIVRLHCSGEQAYWFSNKGFDGPVYDILIVQDGSIVVGGAFDKYGDTTSKGVVRLSPNGVIKNAYTQFDRTSSSEGVFALAEADTAQPSVWVGGDFSSYNSDTSFGNLVRINLDSGANELSSSPLLNQPVRALGTTSGSVYVGGDFSAPVKRLIKLSNDGSRINSFSAGDLFEDAPVKSIAVSGSYLFVGALTKIVKLDAATGNAVSAFGSSGTVTVEHGTSNIIPSVDAVVTDGSSVYVGGRFTSVNSTAAHNFCKLSGSDGTVDTDFDSAVGVNDAVRSLSLFNSGSRLSLVGEFSTLGGTPANRLAAFSASGVFNSNLNGSLGGGFNDTVRALQWSGNDLYVGGAFTQINSDSTRPYLVRLTSPLTANGTSSVVDSSFDTTSGGTLNGEVRALALAPDNSENVFVGGAFSQYKGATHNGLVLMGSNGTVVSAFNGLVGVSLPPPYSVSLPAVVNTLSVTPLVDEEYSIFAGGQFGSYRNIASPNLVKIKHTGQRDGAFLVGSGFNGPVLTSALSGTTLYAGGEFTEFNGTASNLVALNAASASLVASQSLGGSIRSVVVANSDVWAGGSFFIGQSSLARFNENLVLESSPESGKLLLGPHAQSEFHSSSMLNSLVAGVHSLLPVTETVNESPTLRLFVTGFFALLNNFSGNNSVRMDSSGTEAVVNPDTP